MASGDKPQSSKISGGELLSLFLSQDLRGAYFAFLLFFCLVGILFVVFGLAPLYEPLRGRSLKTNEALYGLGYVSVGLLFLVLAFAIHQTRRYLYRIQKQTVDRITGIELSKLNEDDFERFDDVRRLREEKAQKDFERNLSAKFILERFGARDVRLFSRVVWDLQPGINVLLGRNGYGKSLILHMIAAILQRDEKASESLFTGSPGSSSSSGPGDSVFEIRLKRDGEDVTIRRNSLRFVESIGKIPVLAIPDSRFFDRSQQTVGPVDTNTADLPTYGAREFLLRKPYGSVIQGLLYELCIEYLQNKDFERGVFQFLRECVRRLAGYDFRFHSIERRGRVGFEIRVLTEGNDEPVPIQSASQGTLSVLAMCGLIRSYLHAISGADDDAIVQSSSGIVFIDEADAHLHPAWQQKVPSVFKDLFPNVQFILSAHSPLFVAGCWKGEVAVLRRSGSERWKSEFTVEQVERDFVGATSAEIYKQIFEIEELDDTYLEYATKATLRNENSVQINELKRREDLGPLTQNDKETLENLLEENRRIRSAVNVTEKRRKESQKDLRIAELESQILELETRLSPVPKEGKS
jgi:predicted ATPase